MNLVRILAGAGLFSICSFASPAAIDAEPPPTWHFFSGVEVTASSAFVHQGAIWSPRHDLHVPGWRLRGLTDAGAYRYRTDGIATTGRMLGLELMPGYSWFQEDRGVTLYLGGTIHEHRTKPHDMGQHGQGSRFGAKVLAEGWVHLTDTITLDAAAGYATAPRSYTARLAVTLAATEWLVVEPEVSAFGEPGYDQQRLGLLIELHRTPELRVLAGGGWSMDRDGSGAYFSLRLKSWR